MRAASALSIPSAGTHNHDLRQAAKRVQALGSLQEPGEKMEAYDLIRYKMRVVVGHKS
jgi:hypothetical protein